MSVALPDDLQTIPRFKPEHNISATPMASWSSITPKDLALIIIFCPLLLLGACLPDYIIEKFHR